MIDTKNNFVFENRKVVFKLELYDHAIDCTIFAGQLNLTCHLFFMSDALHSELFNPHTPDFAKMLSSCEKIIDTAHRIATDAQVPMTVLTIGNYVIVSGYYDGLATTLIHMKGENENGKLY